MWHKINRIQINNQTNKELKKGNEKEKKICFKGKRAVHESETVKIEINDTAFAIGQFWLNPEQVPVATRHSLVDLLHLEPFGL